MKFFIPIVALAALAAAAPIVDVEDFGIFDVTDEVAEALELNEFEERADFKGGNCAISGKLGYTYSSLQSADFEIRDGAGKSLGKTSGPSTSVFNKGGLPKPLTINPKKAYSAPLVSFIYGDKQFDSAGCKSNKKTSMGSDYFTIDCTFSC